MRRAEFDVKDENSINEVLEVCEYGSLSLISEGKPYVVALIFCCFFRNFLLYSFLFYLYSLHLFQALSPYF